MNTFVFNLGKSVFLDSRLRGSDEKVPFQIELRMAL
jgi:hypothetical protein